MTDDLERYIQKQIERDPSFADLLRESDAELELGLELQRIREARGWTQRELAERAGLPQSTIARYEKAGRTPTVPTLWRLASALNVTVMLAPEYGIKLLDCEPAVPVPPVPVVQMPRTIIRQASCAFSSQPEELLGWQLFLPSQAAGQRVSLLAGGRSEVTITAGR